MRWEATKAVGCRSGCPSPYWESGLGMGSGENLLNSSSNKCRRLCIFIAKKVWRCMTASCVSPRGKNARHGVFENYLARGLNSPTTPTSTRTMSLISVVAAAGGRSSGATRWVGNAVNMGSHLTERPNPLALHSGTGTDVRTDGDLSS